MSELSHLLLRRVEFESQRRKKPGYGVIPKRDYSGHGSKLNTDIDNTIQRVVATPRKNGIDPDLILTVRLENPVDESFWKKLNLTVVAQENDKKLILFSDDNELKEFKARLARYMKGPAKDRKNPYYASVFSNILEVNSVKPEDRIGRLLRFEGVTGLGDILEDRDYVLDLELWHVGSYKDCKNKVEEFEKYLKQNGGKLTDQYIGSSIVLARIFLKGRILRTVLEFEAVAQVDLPPKLSFEVGELVDTPLSGLQEVPAPPPGAQSICTIDSGVSSGHPLLANSIGEATVVPAELGTEHDEHGHGTMVAGIALYGNVKECISQKNFIPELKLFSAKVLNSNNEFDNEKLITNQMIEVIRYFNTTYKCRVFNASLGDNRTPFNGGKLSAWSSILDHLVRELDIIVVVSVGNYEHEPSQNDDHDEHLRDYPKYLLGSAAKVIEPATGCNVLTVGSVAASSSLTPGSHVEIRPIAGVLQPSPFTRSGPGIGNSIKPDFIDFGGNLALCGLRKRTRSVSELSIISTSKNYLEKLFISECGTSFAAPMVAHKAAKLLNKYPSATSNLIRAFLASSANVPDESINLLRNIDKKAALKLCGYGIPSFEKAVMSSENRVVLYTENKLEMDQFHIYEIPIPREIYDVVGKRKISVSLAFDPPVRHSRLDYLGTTMSFRLIRGKSADEVSRAFRERVGEDDLERFDGRYDCKMQPIPTEREGGTLQKGIFTIKRRTEDYGDTYFLVVRCQKEWATEDLFPQRYAIVTTIEHEASVNLYASIQQRVQVKPKVRLKRR